MRKKFMRLYEMEPDQEYEFEGTIEKRGKRVVTTNTHRVINKGGTILLTHITLNGEEVTTHQWLYGDNKDSFKGCHKNHKYKFIAKITKYYRHSDHTYDYTMTNVHDVTIVE